MSDMLVAQCPHCQTRFRLSQEHLQAAAGNVRCGACLKVFDASAQAQPERRTGSAATSSAEPAPQPSGPEAQIPHQGALLIHDDLDLDDLDLEALGLDESILEEINPDARTAHPAVDLTAIDKLTDTPLASEQPSSEYDPGTDALTRHDAAEASPLEKANNPPDPVKKHQSDQAIRSELTTEPATESPLTGTEQSARGPTDDEIDRAFDFDSDPESAAAWDLEFNLDNDLESETARLAQDPDALDDMELHDAFKAAARSRDFEPRPDPIEPTITSPGAEDKTRLFGMHMPEPMRPLTAARDRGIFLRDQPAGFAAGKPDAPLPSTFGDSAYTESQRPTDKRREPSFADHLSLPDVVDEPLYLDDRPLARRPRHQWLWGVLSALAALALLSQALIYNYASLAHDARSRPMMEQICFLAGCELPARVNIELIRSSNLVVRPHADFPNALAIDVILYNRADFAQPFPVLRMIFTDLSGRELSSKLFRPAEYLGGELAGSTLMPPQTPVHVGLSMLDPGPQAASYNLDFLSP